MLHLAAQATSHNALFSVSSYERNCVYSFGSCCGEGVWLKGYFHTPIP